MPVLTIATLQTFGASSIVIAAYGFMSSLLVISLGSLFGFETVSFGGVRLPHSLGDPAAQARALSRRRSSP